MPLKRKLATMGTRAPRAPSIVDAFSLRPELSYVADSVAPEACHLALVAERAPRAVSGEDATSVIVSAPPLQMGQQVWRLLRRSPGTTSQRSYSMSDGEIHPLTRGGVQPTREA